MPLAPATPVPDRSSRARKGGSKKARKACQPLVNARFRTRLPEAGRREARAAPSHTMSTTQPCDSDPPCTATVETLYGMGTEPENAEVVIGEEGSYPKDMFFLMVTVIAIIIILLVVHALYRLSLCCRHCFCRPGTKKGERSAAAASRRARGARIQRWRSRWVLPLF